MSLLEGRVCVVTGASRGLGAAMCRVFAREGADIAFNYAKDDESAAGVVESIKALGRRATATKVSVTDGEGVNAWARSVVEEFDRVDVLVNNAGVGQVVPLALMEESDWDRLLGIHAKGAFLASRAFMRPMIKARYGRILNMSSLAGVKMMQAPVHYSTAKAALKGFTESLAKEIGRYGVTVNCIAPGILEEGVSQNLPKEKLDEYLRNCALGRVGTSDEVAELAAFLVSARNSYMNGATVVVDGAV